MEKFSQFRDRGSGIAPFLPIPTEPSGIYLPFHLFLYMFRVPMMVTVIMCYFLFLQWLPIGGLGRKAALWTILGIPGIWWIDLQIDGVRRGSINRNLKRLPYEGTVIAASSASPIDALYLAAIFDPVFTASYPTTRLVRPLTLFEAIYRAFISPQEVPTLGAKLVDLETLLAAYPNRVIVVFPECTTSNGRGILPLSSSLLTAPATTKVFPVHLRYTAADITTPIPGAYFTFFWNLCSKPTHCIRIRIAEAVYNTSRSRSTANTSGYNANYFDSMADSVTSDADTIVDGESQDEPITKEEKVFLDRIAEALARLGRVKRVGLGLRQKKNFVASWTKTRKR